MKTSGFSFVHNAIAGGYPIREAIEAIKDYVDEIVIVDCQSDDGTRTLLDKLGVRIIDGEWGHQAGETLAAAHALHTECKYNTIVHFEADEVYDHNLIREIAIEIDMGNYDLSVWRLQLEQNFQRCRWYPELVHRVFPKGSVSKQGHTTTRHSDAKSIDQRWGYLWDVTNCFRDNWINRTRQQAELWMNEPIQEQFRRVPLHFLQDPLDFDVEAFLREPQWTWTMTPFNIPEVLRPLVGRTKYTELDTPLDTPMETFKRWEESGFQR